MDTPHATLHPATIELVARAGELVHFFGKWPVGGMELQPYDWLHLIASRHYADSDWVADITGGPPGANGSHPPASLPASLYVTYRLIAHLGT